MAYFFQRYHSCIDKTKKAKKGSEDYHSLVRSDAALLVGMVDGMEILWQLHNPYHHIPSMYDISRIYTHFVDFYGFSCRSIYLLRPMGIYGSHTMTWYVTGDLGNHPKVTRDLFQFPKVNKEPTMGPFGWRPLGIPGHRCCRGAKGLVSWGRKVICLLRSVMVFLKMVFQMYFFRCLW